MIENFVDSVLIIDDQGNEIQELSRLLDEKQIWNAHLIPEKLLKDKPILRNRKLIFLDLFVDETKASIKDQLALIRRIFTDSIGTDFGAYGIVLWTKHPENFTEFKEKFYQSYGKYDLPLFIVALDKTKYLRFGFDDIFTDLNKTLLDNPGSNFFINWEIAVTKSKDQSLRQIYDLVNANQEENLYYVLFKLAKNFTGIPLENLDGYDLEHDALKAFSDLLSNNINNFPKVSYGLFANWKEIKYSGQGETTSDFKYSIENFIPGNIKEKDIQKDNKSLTQAEKKTQYSENIEELENEIRDIQSKVNRVLLFDDSNIDKTKVFPGAIYKVISKDSSFILEEKPESSYEVVIEVTPPCDFSQNKLRKRRLVAGFVCNYDKTLDPKFKGDFFYKELWPVWIDEEIKMVVFDFRYFGSIDEKDLLNTANYELILKTKNKLFADVLQKLSSHTARLGLSVLH